MTDSPAIEINGLDKSYTPGVPVLSDFDLTLARREVHALVGSNGAGKSTLAKILTGLTPANAGNVFHHGEPFAPSNKQEATERGVVMVLQELNIIPTLTVAENLFLHQLPHRGGIVNHHQLTEQAHQSLKQVGLDRISPDAPAGSLGIGQQQLVEIAATLTQHSSVLILDEPTAALTGPEIELLFENIERLKSAGVAILYISHRMDEIFRIADTVTVMRDGKRIATHEVSSVTTRQLVREMAGSEIADRQPSSRNETGPTVGLEVRNLKSNPLPEDVSFTAYRGEILGIAGLIGSGRTETLKALFGAEPILSGEIRMGPEATPIRPRSPSDAVASGMALIPEDRKSEGLLLSRSIIENTSLSALSDQADFGWIETTREQTNVAKACDRLEVKRDSLDQPVSKLSGGNQQKVVIARWLLRHCEVLLFDEPTRGIDVAAKESIYELLDELAAAEKTLIVVSSDLTELMSISHRIVVMSNGRITGEFHPEDWSQESITAAAFAGYEKNSDAA